MAETRVLGRDMQEEFLKAIRRSQELVVGAIRTWAEAVEPYAPKLPLRRIPLAQRLPKPGEVVENTYDFAEKLLANQRKFAEEVLKAAAPLAPKATGAARKPRPASK